MRTNYWAVLVCAVVYWLLGGLWYDLLFSKQWMALENMSAAQASYANAVWIWPFILTFLLNLLIAFVPGANFAWPVTVGGIVVGLALGWVLSRFGRRSDRAKEIWLILATFAALVALTVSGLLIHPELLPQVFDGHAVTIRTI